MWSHPKQNVDSPQGGRAQPHQQADRRRQNDERAQPHLWDVPQEEALCGVYRLTVSLLGSQTTWTVEE
jgi:hypothetical protein